jgi:Ran GTPase-activating protein (RanGAP) involved in mRNA processing and transport
MGTVDDGRPLLSSTFLDFCSKVRNNDPSIFPNCGTSFKIRPMCEREGIELADALLESTSVTYLELEMEHHTKSSAEAMAKYVRTNKHLQHIHWSEDWDRMIDHRLRHREEMFSCFLPAIQESTSLKELNMQLPSRGNQALEDMLTHTQSLRSLTLHILPRYIDGAAVQSGLKKNTTLRELTLDFSRDTAISPILTTTATLSPILTSLRNHPLLRRLCLCGELGRGELRDLTGLDTVLLSDTSKITELDIDSYIGSPTLTGLKDVLIAMAQRPTLTKLRLCECPLGCDEARLLQMALCTIPSLHTLVLGSNDLGSTELATLAPALYHNTSIKVLDLSDNYLKDVKSARVLRDILRRNKTITTLNLSGNEFGQTTGAVACIAEGMGSNSTVLKLDLSNCDLGDGGVSTLAQSLGSRNTTLQKLTLDMNNIRSTGVGVLLETMEQSSKSITDLELRFNTIGNRGASLLARSLGNNALPNLTRLSLFQCGIGDDGFIALVLALKKNASLLHLDLCNDYPYFSEERIYLALAKSLPEIKVLQQVDLSWCTGLGSAMPLLLAGLRKNTSLLRFHVENGAPYLVPPTPQQTVRYAGDWMQKMEGLGYRNRCLALMRAPKETLPPISVWPHALARVATYPDFIFEVLCSKPTLVPSEDTGGKEAAKDTGVPTKRERGDN